MPDEYRSTDSQQPLEVILHFKYESRHELVAELAYKHWEQRGRPLGSPEVDWSSGRASCVRVVSSVGVNYILPGWRAGYRRKDLPRAELVSRSLVTATSKNSL